MFYFDFFFSDSKRVEGNYLVYIDLKRPLDRAFHTKLLSKLGGMNKAICCVHI